MVGGGSAVHRKPRVLGRHERSRQACQVCRSPHLHVDDLDRCKNPTAGSNPTRRLPRGRAAPCQRGRRRRGRASPCGQAGSYAAKPYERRPRPPCHYRAIHKGPYRSQADTHGQHHSGFDRRRFLSSQVITPPALALGAGSRIVYSCFRQFDPCGWRVLLDAVLRWRIRFRSRRLRCRRDGIRRA
jgi:hypothetical protein